jgi:DNA-directed RNA polymerase I and III subunit RPAC1
MRSRDSSKLGRDRIDNTETASSPHTFAHSPHDHRGSMPDHPVIRNVQLESAVAGLAANSSSSSERNTATSPAYRVQSLSFDIDNITAPIANLLRRLFVMEVPTMAFDRILIEENDGVVLDEILSHRIGLTPLAAPPQSFSYITTLEEKREGKESSISFNNLDPKKCLLFTLDVQAPADQQITIVYSRHLKWQRLPGQEHLTEEDVFVVHPDIVLAKLGPLQRVKLQAVAIKGLALCHNKWSPVSACWYQFANKISFASPVVGDAAVHLKKTCPMRVFDIEEAPENTVAVVRDASRCSCCRECIRTDAHPLLMDHRDRTPLVVLEKAKTSVRFTLETTGQVLAPDVVRTGLSLFAERVRDLAQRVRTTEVNCA